MATRDQSIIRTATDLQSSLQLLEYERQFEDQIILAHYIKELQRLKCEHATRMKDSVQTRLEASQKVQELLAEVKIILTQIQACEDIIRLSHDVEEELVAELDREKAKCEHTFQEKREHHRAQRTMEDTLVLLSSSEAGVFVGTS
ncbi:hypothetical protein PG985_004846 [Apiospora marii]|uniref:uncharacterized protein n=1 Tax=Apiospora marii TaxID=335849 RepID=UPI00312E7B85